MSSKPKISWSHAKVDSGSGNVNSGIAEHFLSGGADAVIKTILKIPVGHSSVTQEGEPVTMSEVAVKLDLARAYMDMGNPDTARDILKEVLAEGSARQQPTKSPLPANMSSSEKKP